MCKHLNCEVQEEFMVHDIIFVKDGAISWQRRDLEYAVPTGRFFVRCYDCGMECSYKSHRPKWLERILDKALSAPSLAEESRLQAEDLPFADDIVEAFADYGQA